MIIVLKPRTTEENLNRVIKMVETKGLEAHVVRGEEMTIIGCIGDTVRIDPRLFEVDQSVDKVMHVQEPYKLANRAFHPEDTIVDVSGIPVGGGHMAMIAGPCSVESEEQVIDVAKAVKEAGANMLRGGAFKPRTSPYSFQGLGLEGLEMLCRAKEETGLPIVTELMSGEYLDIFDEKVDLIQIGARNMQNFDLLKQLGRTKRPILLKRGLNATYEEWIMSAEYIMASGNENVILCERGDSGAEEDDPSTGCRRSKPCRRKMVACRYDGESSPGSRNGRADDRGPQQSGLRLVRRRSVPETGKIRGTVRAAPQDRTDCREDMVEKSVKIR